METVKYLHHLIPGLQVKGTPMFCFMPFILNITFPKGVYHFIGNAMAEQIHFVFSHSDPWLSICSVSGECSLLISNAQGYTGRQWGYTGRVSSTLLVICEERRPSALTKSFNSDGLGIACIDVFLE